ncbi:MAG: hypothetical protein KFF77_05540, partial [Bacteroidetes bacterium]|nr:hypothetical protein [Bacteroidota bacterium]
MRRLILLFVLLALCIGDLHAEDASVQDLFRQGVQRCRAADCRGAIGMVGELAAEGYSGFDLYYNLGAANYKNGDLGKSILY